MCERGGLPFHSSRVSCAQFFFASRQFLLCCFLFPVWIEWSTKAAGLAPWLQHIATHCDTLRHTATHCNTLQHTAAHCSTHCNSSIFIVLFYKETWHSIEPLNQTTRCNSLQHTTTHYKHCNTLQHSATHCRDCNKPQHTATHCNTLQHAAAHSNTLPSPHIVSTMDG